MRVLGSSVLTFEALMVLLAIPVAVTLGRVHNTPLMVGAFVGVAVVCLLAVGVVTRPYGPAVGWGVQLLVLATGFLVPAMFILGAMFAGLWFLAVRLGTQADAQRAAVSASADAIEPAPPPHEETGGAR